MNEMISSKVYIFPPPFFNLRQ